MYICSIVVQSLSGVRHFAAAWTVVRQAPLSSTISQSLLKFMSIESVMLSNHIKSYHWFKKKFYATASSEKDI